jgi:prepilin-type N-terminal cleavage/methylation domain-containing protein
MKKGFTLIEVVVCIMLLCILLVPIFGLSSLAYNVNTSAKLKDEEFNIARGVCEKFRSEEGVIDNKLMVIYSNGIEDIPFNISDTLRSCIYEGSSDYSLLLSNNIENKRYAIILTSKAYENISFLGARVISIGYKAPEVVLKIAR